MNDIIKIAAVMAISAALSGNLPKILYKIRIAQLHLIKESQASKWGKAWTPK